MGKDSNFLQTKCSGRRSSNAMLIFNSVIANLGILGKFHFAASVEWSNGVGGPWRSEPSIPANGSKRGNCDSESVIRSRNVVAFVTTEGFLFWLWVGSCAVGSSASV